LGVLFSTAAKQVQSDLKAVLQTETMKSKARLHMIYESDQVKPILNFLKKAHPNLHTCCLLTYGCFLRPHEEVRNLTKRHFKKDFTEIHLSGDENKGGRVRVVYVPDYIRKHLTKTLDSLQLDDNIFSHSPTPFNDAYFNTAWTRA
jgi:integrase